MPLLYSGISLKLETPFGTDSSVFLLLDFTANSTCDYSFNAMLNNTVIEAKKSALYRSLILLRGRVGLCLDRQEELLAMNL